MSDKLPTAPRGWRECTFPEWNTSFAFNTPRGHFVNGEKTKYFIPIEPLKASGVMKYNSSGFCQQGLVVTCGLTYSQVAGKTFKITMEEVIE